MTNMSMLDDRTLELNALVYDNIYGVKNNRFFIEHTTFLCYNTLSLIIKPYTKEDRL